MSKKMYKDVEVEFDFYASTEPEFSVIMATLCLEVWIHFTDGRDRAYRAEKMHRVVELCQSHGPGDLSTMVNMFDGGNMKTLYAFVKPSGREDLIDWLERFFMTQQPDLADSLGIEPTVTTK